MKNNFQAILLSASFVIGCSIVGISMNYDKIFQNEKEQISEGGDYEMIYGDESIFVLDKKNGYVYEKLSVLHGEWSVEHLTND